MRPYRRIKPEAASDRTYVIGCNQIDGVVVVVLVFLMNAINVEVGPATFPNEDLVSEAKLLVQEIAELAGIAAVNDLDH
jgi:hypothetical protein